MLTFSKTRFLTCNMLLCSKDIAADCRDSSVIATTCFAISSLLLLIANWWRVKVITRHNLACDYKQYKIQIPDYLSSIIGCVWKRVSWEFPWKYLVANIADVFLTAILSNVPRLVALVTPAKTFIQHPLVLSMRVKHHNARNTQKYLKTWPVFLLTTLPGEVSIPG